MRGLIRTEDHFKLVYFLEFLRLEKFRAEEFLLAACTPTLYVNDLSAGICFPFNI